MVHTLRVFPRRTSYTPTDRGAAVGPPDLFSATCPPGRVLVSVAFTWDLPEARRLAKLWGRLAPVEIGGPAAGTRGLDFTPGLFLRPGVTITSRGCPKRCPFCSVPARDGPLRELPIRDGWIVQDDNLLATSPPHFEHVIDMLRRQPHRAEFRGGLDAALLTDRHVELLAQLRPRPALFFAYDPGDELGPLHDAVRRLLAAGFTLESHRLRCYVLIGYPGDRIDRAETRLAAVLAAGFFPMAMLYRPPEHSPRPLVARATLHHPDLPAWQRLQRHFARPALMAAARKPDKCPDTP